MTFSIICQPRRVHFYCCCKENIPTPRVRLGARIDPGFVRSEAYAISEPLQQTDPRLHHRISVEELVREGGAECSTAPRVPCSSPAASLLSPETSAVRPHSRTQDGLPRSQPLEGCICLVHVHLCAVFQVVIARGAGRSQYWPVLLS